MYQKARNNGFSDMSPVITMTEAQRPKIEDQSPKPKDRPKTEAHIYSVFWLQSQGFGLWAFFFGLWSLIKYQFLKIKVQSPIVHIDWAKWNWAERHCAATMIPSEQILQRATGSNIQTVSCFWLPVRVCHNFKSHSMYSWGKKGFNKTLFME